MVVSLVGLVLFFKWVVELVFLGIVLVVGWEEFVFWVVGVVWLVDVGW